MIIRPRNIRGTIFEDMPKKHKILFAKRGIGTLEDIVKLLVHLRRCRCDLSSSSTLAHSIGLAVPEIGPFSTAACLFSSSSTPVNPSTHTDKDNGIRK